ncbi:MAG: type II toxin-antitoxin system VapC family toxin [Planctomycetaceae bacterium]|nr:type II toxin-antitoxin system VapC family toxin [Planctomycetaceae bacterium]
MSERYVLDTDCFTLFQRGHEAVVAHAAAVEDGLAITIVTVDESLTGWYSRVRQSKTPEQLATAYRGLHKSVDALRQMEVLPYSQLAIEEQLRLRQQLPRLGKMDLAIAAIALEFDATLVTRNRIDFEQIPGLKIEDWSQP